jgi:hypothetical protein
MENPMNVKLTGHAHVADRRLNNKLREHFDTAERLLEPILAKATALNGTLLYRLMHKLQTAYPDLSPSEIEALMAAVIRSVEKQQRALRLVVSN